jgi:hypothetical protein
MKYPAIIEIENDRVIIYFDKDTTVLDISGIVKFANILKEIVSTIPNTQKAAEEIKEILKG